MSENEKAKAGTEQENETQGAWQLIQRQMLARAEKAKAGLVPPAKPKVAPAKPKPDEPPKPVEPSPEALIASVRVPPSVAPVKPVAKPTALPQALPLRQWSEVVVPKGANDLETLTYVPGLVGDVVEWIVLGARRPNRMMALGVASVVVGTLIGHRIQGPTRSSTHLNMILLAPTGSGKDWPLQAGPRLLDRLGRSDLIGPSEWASAPGFTNRMKRDPLMACFMDELGDELCKVSDGGGGGVWVTAIIGLLKKAYNAWDTIMTAEKVGEASERIDWPAPSIVGAATPQKFFGALKPGDLESGFANRLFILPFEHYRKPPEQTPPDDADEPSKELLAGLRLLPKRIKPGKDEVLNAPADVDGPARPPLHKIGWGDGAADVYKAFSGELDLLEDGDSQRHELSMRACENAVRLATIVAVGRGSPTVDVEDIGWAIVMARQSLDAACGGVAKYMREHYDFPKLCDQVLGYIVAEGGWASRRDIERKFRGNLRNGFDMPNVIKQLLLEKRIEVASRAGLRGPSADGFRVIGDE
jgi:hypothetical protein